VVDTVESSWGPILYRLEPGFAAPPSLSDANDLARTRELQTLTTPEWERTSRWWSAGGVRRWNEIARHLLTTWQTNSGYSARILALLAVAQYDAALAARRAAERFNRDASDPARLALFGTGMVAQYSYPSEDAAIAQASLEILREFFPAEEGIFLEQNALAHVQTRIWMGAARHSDVEAGRKLGSGAAAAALAWARNDGIEQVNDGRVGSQRDRWHSFAQTLPGFGRLRPWTMRSGDQFRAPPPPDVHSDEFADSLAEVRTYSDRLSAEQLAIAQYWNLGVGGISVPGMWDLVALDLAFRAKHGELQTARTLALLNIAMMDACIASWDTKYHYLVPRPSMRDPGIREPLGLPSHPSYTSGHSAFSGAAEGILSVLFRDAAAELHLLAEEASASRWYAGIHYRFDGDEGLKQGRAVAAWVLEHRAAKEATATAEPGSS
jgi:membrane-associated phospholipid phosphatase